MDVESKEKDMLISQLKAHMFELEQRDSDYKNLESKYKNLMSETSLLNDAKIRLEYEARQKNENFNKQAMELRNENQGYQMQVNEKVSVYSKLLSERDSLQKQLDRKNEELRDLTEKIRDLSAQLDKNQEDKIGMEKLVKGLTDVKENQSVEIKRLVDDNKQLSRICQEQDTNLKEGDKERQDLANQIDAKSYEVKNLTGQLRSREENLNFTQRQLEGGKDLSNKLQSTIGEYKENLDKIKNDLDGFKDNLIKERELRAGEEKRGQDLEIEIQNKEREINRMGNDLNNLNAINQRVKEDKNMNNLTNEKLRAHIMTLTQQNQKLIDQIESVIDEDERMKEQLARKERTLALIKNSQNAISQSEYNLLDYLKKSNDKMPNTMTQNMMASNSGRRTYSRVNASPADN